jgi:hypothetical protein
MSATVTVRGASATCRDGVWSGDPALSVVASALTVGVERTGADPELDRLYAGIVANSLGGEVTAPRPRTGSNAALTVY